MQTASLRSPACVLGPRSSPVAPVRPTLAPRAVSTAARSGSTLIVSPTPLGAHAAPQCPQVVARPGYSARQSLAQPPSALNTGGAGFGMADVYGIVARFTEAFICILTIRVLLSWLRGIDWSVQPLRILREWTDPALNAVRNILPPIGGIDISPLLLFFALAFIAKQLRVLAAHAG